MTTFFASDVRSRCVGDGGFRHSVAFRKARNLPGMIVEALEDWCVYSNPANCERDFGVAAEYFRLGSKKNLLLKDAYRNSHRMETHIELCTGSVRLRVMVGFHQHFEKNPGFSLEVILEPGTGRIKEVGHRKL